MFRTSLPFLKKIYTILEIFQLTDVFWRKQLEIRENTDILSNIRHSLGTKYFRI